MNADRLNIPLLTSAFRKYRLSRLVQRPAEVCIETTSRCNVDCIMCPRKKMQRPQQAMDFNLFKKIVDECVDIGVECIKPHNYGEPLLTPSFDKYLSYIRSKSKKMRILLVTNGTLLNEQMTDLIIGQAINEVVISIDGVTQSTYDEIRKGSNFNRVSENVEKLIKKKQVKNSKHPKVVLSMVRMNQSDDEVQAFQQKWQSLADQVCITEYSSRGGTLKSFEDGSKRDRKPCFRLWKQAVVCSNGKLALCCSDWDCEVELGDLNRDALQPVWQNSQLEKIRNLHLRGKACEISICSKCDPEIWDSMPRWWF